MLKNFERMDVKMPPHTLVNVENLLQHALAVVHTFHGKNNHPVLAKQLQNYDSTSASVLSALSK